MGYVGIKATLTREIDGRDDTTLETHKLATARQGHGKETYETTKITVRGGPSRQDWKKTLLRSETTQTLKITSFLAGSYRSDFLTEQEN